MKPLGVTGREQVPGSAVAEFEDQPVRADFHFHSQPLDPSVPNVIVEGNRVESNETLDNSSLDALDLDTSLLLELQDVVEGGVVAEFAI